MKTLTVVIDLEAYECLYIDGKRWDHPGKMTVYACDIAEAAGDQPVMIAHTQIEHEHKEWPETLEAALAAPVRSD